MEAGLDVDEIDDVIPRSKYSLARRALHLPSARQLRSVVHLAHRFQLPELEVREKLFAAGILEAQTDRVPRSQFRKVSFVLRPNARMTSISPDSQRSPIIDGASTAGIPLRRGRRSRGVSKSVGVPWRTIGSPEPITYLQAGDVVAIHQKLVEDFARGRDPIQPPGVREPALLESALSRPHTSLGASSKYPTVSMAGAALLHAIVHDHPFHNGNKRTALVSLIVFLDKHGYILVAIEDELFEYVLRVAAHEIVPVREHSGQPSTDSEMLDIAQWLQRHVRRIRKGESCMKFRELKRVLSVRGCDFEILSGNRINILRNALRTQVFYASGGREVDGNTIHKIRHDLQLDDEHGYDSDIFYNAGRRIDDFINRYRKTLDRLAKL